MAKSKETFNKKEREKKRQKSKEDKLEKKLERKASAQKGKPLDDMIAYVDENGNLSSTPPDPQKRKVFNIENISTGVPIRTEEEENRTGVVDFFNETKGYGFIKDALSKQSIFVHASQIAEPLKENDKVSFQTERTPRGLSAIQVKRLK
jgi:cold shock CspA family protein